MGFSFYIPIPAFIVSFPFHFITTNLFLDRSGERWKVLAISCLCWGTHAQLSTCNSCYGCLQYNPPFTFKKKKEDFIPHTTKYFSSSPLFYVNHSTSLSAWAPGVFSHVAHWVLLLWNTSTIFCNTFHVSATTSIAGLWLLPLTPDSI